MYAFFYPETNKRATASIYKSVEAARQALLIPKRSWSEINAPAEIDLAAFLDDISGIVFVVREL